MSGGDPPALAVRPSGPKIRSIAGLLAMAALTLIPAPLSAQENSSELTGQLVRRVTFPGADAVSPRALRETIATRPTRCRGLLLRPLCRFTDWDVIVERHRFDAVELPRDELRLLVVYFREGFREAEVASSVDALEDGVGVEFYVAEGPPTLLEALEVIQAEDVLGSRDIARAGLPGEGRPFNLGRLEEGMGRLAERLAEHGYLDAVVRDSIDVSERSARVDLFIEPGRRSTVRAIEIRGNDRIEDETIALALHFDEGDVLTAPMVRQSRRSLHQTSLFYEADVVVPDQPDSAKVVEVTVREAPPRMARVGGGFNTLDFAQLEGRFSHYNWRGGGRRLDLRTTVGNLLAPQLNDRFIFRDILPGELAGVDRSPFERPTWQASAELTQPAFRGTRNRLGLSAFAHRRVIPAIAVDRGFGAEVSVTRRLGFQMPASLAYRYEVVSLEAGDVYFCVSFSICDPGAIRALRGHTALSPLTLSLLVDRSDDPLAPTSGYQGRIDFEHASRPTGSDFRYNRVSADASYYLAFGPEPRHVVAGHVQVGWIRSLGGTAQALGLDEGGAALLHPRKRFYSGGARSVRGYPESQLGPRILTIPREDLIDDEICTPEEVDDASCDPSLAPIDAFAPWALGGSSLLEGQVEYRFPIAGVTGAVFVDGALVGGRVEGFLQDVSTAVTPGFGVRFASAAGPIRIDIGFRKRDVAFLPVVTETETEVGGEIVGRELIQLSERLRFDPLADKGFVGRALGRLTIHFSIGEAF